MLLFGKNCPNCQSYYDVTLNECPNCHKSNELHMQRDVSSEVVFLHPTAQIGLFLGGFAYAGMLFLEIIVAIFFVGTETNVWKESILMFLTYLLMLGGLISIPLFTRKKAFLLKFTRPVDYAFAAFYAGMIILAGLVISLFVSAFYSGSLSTGNQNKAVELIENYPILMFFASCLIAPICEELTYRVGLYSFLRRINKVLAILVSAFIFAFVHFTFDFNNIAGELLSVPTYFMSGVLLALAYEHRGPACSIAAHTFYNITAFLTIIMAK